MALVNFPCIKHGGWDSILFCQDFPSALKHINGLITTPTCRKHGAATLFTRPNALNDFERFLRQSVFMRFRIL